MRPAAVYNMYVENTTCSVYRVPIRDLAPFPPELRRRRPPPPPPLSPRFPGVVVLRPCVSALYPLSLEFVPPASEIQHFSPALQEPCAYILHTRVENYEFIAVPSHGAV